MRSAFSPNGRWGFLLLYAVLLALPSACGSAGARYAKIDRALQSGHPTEAVAVLENERGEYGKRSEVLYLMDRGMVQHLAGLFAESNRSLEKAEELSDDLYTRRILSEVEAFLTSDNALPYEGEDFEKVWLNVLMALNYVELGQWDDALVEARKVDHKLNVLAERNGRKSTYTKDAFARYLSGIVYEAVGDRSNAFVAYRLALEAFEQARSAYGTPVPDMLRRDLLRVSETLGLNSEHEEYKQAFPGLQWQSEGAARGTGELVFITYAGRAPVKRDVFVDVPFSLDALHVVLATKGLSRYDTRNHRAAESILYGLTGRVVRLAVPQFVPRRSALTATEAFVSSGEAGYSARSALMEDITTIAMKDLDDRLLRTSAKAVARSAWKYAMAEGVRIGVREAVGKEGGAIAGAVAGTVARIMAIASEEADKRSWVTLPDRVHLGRLVLPPGTYDVEFRHLSGSGSVLARHTVRGVTVLEGQKRFLAMRILQ